MLATDLIHANLAVACQSIHHTRFNALLTAVAAALAGQTTSVTGLGRASPRKITEKANIKQMDRLVGNPRMHQEAATVYQAMAHWLVRQEGRVLSHFFLGLRILLRESANILDDTLNSIRSVIRTVFAAGGSCMNSWGYSRGRALSWARGLKLCIVNNRRHARASRPTPVGMFPPA